MISEKLKQINWGRVILMCIGNICIGMGIAIFKLSELGNDSFSGMNMAVSECIGISYAHFVVLINVCLFVLEFIFGRKYIGLGTIINAVFMGYIATFFYNIFLGLIGRPAGWTEKICIMCVGVLIISFGLSMYQMPNVGVAPYDSLSLIMAEKFKKVPYFWCRISNDAVCALVCFLTGGIVGLGTLVSTFCLGPVIQFFNVHVTGKLLNTVDSMHNKNKMVSERAGV